jgi:hypothetical protein
MIQEVVNSKGAEAITSDHWHVVHSRFVGASRKRPFVRGVESEHADRAACVKAAKALRKKLATEAGSAPVEERDEVFVRRPGFKSLKKARRRAKTAG